MTIQYVDVLYTAVATAENGRDGRVATDDGKLDVIVNPPIELGGTGAGTNPEQLFAAGYSACFQSALSVVARRAKVDVSGSRVTAKVGLGKTESGGFGLTVELDIAIPDLPADTAATLVEQAHEVCPYSNATRGNVEVTLSVV
ncbi:organic hydroperoxide resistance protein [Streptomyces cocklensis]|jgi:Ohr subfamily peroxiredoxin|uniref:Organic hydroperoxide resistance reductase B n=1 Tax=Actinacidiphila cocklensis TaxID=887465 RepID=A0A9W4DS38_9ACTN|nr:organic hydroperoxide resistance protein [Actinacidiphila cocklensis]MDD1057969.1 organic hydroperoxide resistance protein [Actinacidiphila cocklensis]WSX74347.1 organic hydroperoxide resistance protein [Streptomyces sp. NBC_00899]WSX79588.1 organic hydroperoxide resistance protein [Streptomyces sp. NBC_00899]CAG6392978.1 organic hydroperoxide resistance reductase B [Actinacidiphila cocklensis]